MEMIPMARPTKWRKIEHIPTVPYFIPSEKDFPESEKNILKLEELEAIRLKDLLGMEQEECAANMGVSRPTFQRILISAREKVADSLINGKTILIEGGNFTLNICPVKCAECGKEWKEIYENLDAIKSGDYVCPDCGSQQVFCDQSCKDKPCRKSCCRRYLSID
ncbi:MAG: hypothetical protein K0Q48_3572 [Bacillota bacterium]|jgi:predicted DNA-binding protein (UPF0251 family)/DNA-directed RNA polymerase subunit RPC12/RpoP|nr:hypothetical protein [Bacillota bacterium]